jgi:2Fe-2S ferredoxin
MPKVTFIEFDDTVHALDAELGATMMETALQGGVTSIVAECGGACSCATCHVYVDDAWVERLEPKTAEEEDQLDAAFDVRPNSRLSCQIKVTETLDGLVLRTPSYQGR